jgi:protein-L-isoaspartate(D-aspartate) O-methyltransferase
VFSVERVPLLFEQARAALAAAGVTNVSLLMGDGTLGWRDYAPYDAIVVAAASPDVPGPLLEQLAPRGRMLLPLGERGGQALTLVRQVSGRTMRSRLAGARFVPLLGTFGFDA